MRMFLIVVEASDGHGGAIHRSYVYPLAREPHTTHQIEELEAIMAMELRLRSVVFRRAVELPDQDSHRGFGPYYGYQLGYVTVSFQPYAASAGRTLWVRSQPIQANQDVRDIEEALGAKHPGTYVTLTDCVQIDLTPDIREQLERQGFGSDG